jgi:hypothetical protein
MPLTDTLERFGHIARSCVEVSLPDVLKEILGSLILRLTSVHIPDGSQVKISKAKVAFAKL